MDKTKNTCCSNTVDKKSSKINFADQASIFTTILLILAPKCPYCVLAYTSSILLFLDIENSFLLPYTPHYKTILGTIIFLIICYNYKGFKTLISITISGIALILLITTNYFSSFLIPDGFVYFIFLFAAWYNGNFFYFKSFLQKKIKGYLLIF